jgi:homoserine dehydrogenase
MALSSFTPQLPNPVKQPVRPISPERQVSSSKIAILGFGTVGRAVARILSEQQQASLHLTHVFNRAVERKRDPWVGAKVRWTERYQEVLESDVNIVVEVMGGIEPAYTCIRQALIAGKCVVTANKLLVAEHGTELVDLAEKTGSQLEFGASVCGGVPVINAVQYGLAGDRLERLTGILNGTCNFILSNMEKRGLSLIEALGEAQKLGYAEANPADDLSGVDACCKLTILARLGLNTRLDPVQVATESIAHIQPCDFVAAKALGCTIRQISRAELRTGSVFASVGPMLVGLDSPLARTVDNQNVLVTLGRHGGETVLAGRGAGGEPTAVAVVSDLLKLSQHRSTLKHQLVRKELNQLPVTPEFRSRHYLRICSAERRSITTLARRIFREHQVKLRVLPTSDMHAPNVAFELSECETLTAKSLVKQILEAAPLSRPVLLAILP